jgi:hypothetical protein
MSKPHSLGQEVFYAAKEAIDASSHSVDQFRRTALINLNGEAIDLDQVKFPISDEEQHLLAKVGAKAFATAEWFEDVSYGGFEDANGNTNYHSPHVSAFFPVGYFPNVEPNVCNDDDTSAGYEFSYGTRSGYGDGVWELELVDPHERTVRQIVSTNTEDLDAYNEHTRWYLEQLSIDPTILFDRIRHIRGVAQGDKLRFSEISVTKFLRESTPPRTMESPRMSDGSAYLLGRKGKKGFAIDAYKDGTPPTVEYWRASEDERLKPASDKLLRAVLDKLVILRDTPSDESS